MAKAKDRVEQDTSDIVAMSIDQQRAKLELADKMLLEIAGEERKPTYDEWSFLTSVGLDEKTIRRNITRCTRVGNIKAVAGASKVRQRAQLEAEAAEAKLKTEGEAIEAEIARLSSQHAAMQRDANMKSKRVEQMELACSQLRELVPDHIKANYDREVATLNECVRRNIFDMEIRANEIHFLLGKHIEEQKASPFPQDSAHHASLVQDWKQRRKLVKETDDQLRAELQQLQAAIVPLQAEYDEGIAEAKKLLDHYID